MGDVTVCKVPKEGSNSFYVVQAEWNEDSFELVLLENDSAWTGNMSAAQIQEFCQQWDYTVDDYISETRTALTTHTGASRFSYFIQDEKFTWKKHSDDTGNIKVIFGFVDLRNISVFSTFETLMGNVLQTVQTYQEQIKDLECEKINFKREREVLIQKLDNYVTEKNNLEENLYLNFLTILNAKKEKIKSLQQQQEEQQQEQQQLSPPSESDKETPVKIYADESPVAIKKSKIALPKRKPNSKVHSSERSSVRALAFISSIDNTLKPSTSRQDEKFGDLWDYDGETQVDDSDEECVWKNDDPAECKTVPICSLPKRKNQMKS